VERHAASNCTGHDWSIVSTNEGCMVLHLLEEWLSMHRDATRYKSAHLYHLSAFSVRIGSYSRSRPSRSCLNLHNKDVS
jgi:hypothetical protein